MAKSKIGGLPPRYSFIINPYSDQRLSRCPQCQKLTHLRKFALLINVDDWGPMVLGKTCRYCTPCALIMAHQNELESELAYSFASLAPEVFGNEYIVLGTVDKKSWKQGLKGGQPQLEETLQQMADFKRVLTLEVEPGGRYG